MKRGNWLVLVTLYVLLVLVFAGCANSNNRGAEDVAEARNDHLLLQYFTAQNPQYPVIKSVSGDVNNDGREDLIVIYNIAKDTNRMLVVPNLEAGCVFTNELPAPVTNQHIQFKDIDNKPPVEFIVRGAKGNVAGMAIYRVQDKKLENLFGEGMADCCN